MSIMKNHSSTWIAWTKLQVNSKGVNRPVRKDTSKTKEQKRPTRAENSRTSPSAWNRYRNFVLEGNVILVLILFRKKHRNNKKTTLMMIFILLINIKIDSRLVIV